MIRIGIKVFKFEEFSIEGQPLRPFLPYPLVLRLGEPLKFDLKEETFSNKDPPLWQIRAVLFFLGHENLLLMVSEAPRAPARGIPATASTKHHDLSVCNDRTIRIQTLLRIGRNGPNSLCCGLAQAPPGGTGAGTETGDRGLPHVKRQHFDAGNSLCLPFSSWDRKKRPGLGKKMPPFPLLRYSTRLPS
jgi:hypothetical protein